jgi:hypothetical protein
MLVLIYGNFLEIRQLEIHLHGQKMTTSVIMLTVAAVVALALRTLGVAFSSGSKLSNYWQNTSKCYLYYWYYITTAPAGNMTSGAGDEGKVANEHLLSLHLFSAYESRVFSQIVG